VKNQALELHRAKLALDLTRRLLEEERAEVDRVLRALGVPEASIRSEDGRLRGAWLRIWAHERREGGL
jgi:hypothetical protein